MGLGLPKDPAARADTELPRSLAQPDALQVQQWSLSAPEVKVRTSKLHCSGSRQGCQGHTPQLGAGAVA